MRRTCSVPLSATTTLPPVSTVRDAKRFEARTKGCWRSVPMPVGVTPGEFLDAIVSTVPVALTERIETSSAIMKPPPVAVVTPVPRSRICAVAIGPSTKPPAPVREPATVLTLAVTRSTCRKRPIPSRTVSALPRRTMPVGDEIVAAVPMPSASAELKVPLPARVSTAPAVLPARRTRRTRWSLRSLTSTSPLAATAMPNGERNFAVAAAPSRYPAVLPA